MSEAQIAALLIAIMALPVLAVSALCLTGKLGLSAFARARDPQTMRKALGLGLLLIGVSLLGFAVAVAMLPLTSLRWLTPAFAAGITLICLLLTVWMIRQSR